MGDDVRQRERAAAPPTAESAHAEPTRQVGETASTSPDQRPISRSSLLYLQRVVGNRAVAGLMAVQRELKLNDGPSVAVGVAQQQLNAAGAKPRLAITGRFDAATETAVKAFQKANKIGETGIIDDAATKKKLDELKPSITAGGVKTVESKDAEPTGRTSPGTHSTLTVDERKAGVAEKDLKLGSKGMGVQELQQRINRSPTMDKEARKKRAVAKNLLVVDGRFGPMTETALKQFQTDQTIAPADGVATKATWDKLEKAGSASAGRVEFEWREEVEGVTNVGERARYEWKIEPKRLLITARIQFVPMKQKKDKKGNVTGVVPTSAGDVSGRIQQWLTDIRQVWSTFKVVNMNNPKEFLNVDFAAVQGAGDFKINAIKGNDRSNSANWYTGDARRGLAPHEFGHLIGLADEYNREEGQYLTTTGQEPPVGDVAGDAAKVDTLVAAIKAQMPITDKAALDANGNKIGGQKLATAVFSNLGQKQGGYSRRVAQRYQELHKSSIVADITAAFKTAGFPGFHNMKSFALTPFLYSNQSIMGTMQTAEKAAVKAVGHEHAVEARHIKPFAEIVVREKSLERKAKENWEPKRR